MKMPLRTVRLGSRTVDVERLAGGVLKLKSVEPLAEYDRRATDRLLKWAAATPETIFLADRNAANGWRTFTYGQTLELVRSIGQALLDRNLGPDRPLAILSENDAENLLLAVSAMHVGVPYVPISPNYSLLSEDFGRLKYIFDLVKPGLVFASNGREYGRALRSAVPADADVVVVRNPPDGARATLFEELTSTAPTGAVEKAFESLTRSDVAKIIFTSGSTGSPKGALITHGTLCAGRQQMTQAYPLLIDEPPVIVDWLPWHHVMGGSWNFGIALHGGGSFYIDPGRPTPDGVKETVRCLKEVSPTYYANVPKGFQALLPYFKQDRQLRETFFKRLTLLMFGGANLPAHIWDELDRFAVEITGRRVLISGGLGATESGPTSLTANWDWGPDAQGICGLPLPGMMVKLLPLPGGRWEFRTKGPSVVSGYFKRDDLADVMFDEEGYFKFGDAVKFYDPEDLQKGIVFDGRISEDFKLSSMSWVNVGALRTKVQAAFSPYASDVVITAPNEDFLGAIIFPNIDECRKLSPRLGEKSSPSEVVSDPEVRGKFQSMLDVLKSQSRGNSETIERIVLESDVPTFDTGEMADKGTVSQRAVFDRRPKVIAELHSATPSERTLVARGRDSGSRSGADTQSREPAENS